MRSSFTATELLLISILFVDLVRAVTLSTSCLRVCGEFEQCFVYENAEYCAQLCVPGRCDDNTESCILRGVAPCSSEPCLPEAVCEPKLYSYIGDNGSTSSVCTLNCQLVSSPVCGSDGVSYANACFLKEARCTSGNADLAVASRGLCAAEKELNAEYNPPPSTSSDYDDCVAATKCSNVLDPVCTSAGTMQNVCHFKREQRCGQATLTMVRSGFCDASQNIMSVCPASCTQAYKPVCASNGMLYGNECLFRQAKCARRDLLAVNLQQRPLSECAR